MPKPYEVTVRRLLEISGEAAYLDGMFPPDGTFTIEADGRLYQGVPYVRVSPELVRLELDRAMIAGAIPG
jgi:hypothetical protein